MLPRPKLAFWAIHWLEGLDDQRWAQAMFHLDLLEERGALLGEPYTRQLSGKPRELRFYCSGQRVRVSYWIAPGRRTAMVRCQDEGHTADEEG